ncbi:MAG: transketolase [Actinomycetota bacterium]
MTSLHTSSLHTPQATADYADLPELMGRMTGDEKHTTSATSTLDVLWTLYSRILRIDPARPDDPDRDRFLLSKGHGPMAYYAVLAAHGFFPVELLDGFAEFSSPLGMHPDRALIPGVEIASGSLGHGLPIAVGMTSALIARGNHRSQVFVLLGDAELDEGSNHEAIALAGRMGLTRLTAIVVDNRSATHGWPGGIAERFAVEGWSSVTVSGRDHDTLEAALRPVDRDRPHAVIARVEEKE